jgi:hypothetical protein
LFNLRRVGALRLRLQIDFHSDPPWSAVVFATCSLSLTITRFTMAIFVSFRFVTRFSQTFGSRPASLTTAPTFVFATVIDAWPAARLLLKFVLGFSLLGSAGFPRRFGKRWIKFICHPADKESVGKNKNRDRRVARCGYVCGAKVLPAHQSQPDEM